MIFRLSAEGALMRDDFLPDPSLRELKIFTSMLWQTDGQISLPGPPAGNFWAQFPAGNFWAQFPAGNFWAPFPAGNFWTLYSLFATIGP